MTIEAKVVLDSLAPNGTRLTTFELTYPRFIHAELMTHRVFSRNAASSRAIPTLKKIERIRADMAEPSEWGVNQKGMQAAGPLSDVDSAHAKLIWEVAGKAALDCAERLDKLNVHKQVANRVTECFDHITVVLSTTKLSNHFKLRLEKDPVTGRPLPDPTYFELATKWKAALDGSDPHRVLPGEWHLPYVSMDYDDGGRILYNMDDGQLLTTYLEGQKLDSQDPALRLKVLKMVSAARCARVSYMRQGQGDIAENKVLHDRLTKGGHWAPLEHVATPMSGWEFSSFHGNYDSCAWCGAGQKGNKSVLMDHRHGGPKINICMKCAHGHIHSGNFHGWHQYRKEFAGEAGGD